VGWFKTFFARGSAPEAAQFIDFVGRLLYKAEDDQELPAAVATLLQGLFDQAVQWVSTRPADQGATILAPFGWWYGSGGSIRSGRMQL
jgi:hypothetical protein